MDMLNGRLKFNWLVMEFIIFYITYFPHGYEFMYEHGIVSNTVLDNGFLREKVLDNDFLTSKC